MFKWIASLLTRPKSCSHDYEVLTVKSEHTIDESVDKELYCSHLSRRAVNPYIRYSHKVCLKCNHVVNEIENRRQQIIEERKSTMARQEMARVIVQNKL